MLLLNVNLLSPGGLTYYALSMFDGIESYDVRLPIEQLMSGERLLFPGLYNRQTGEEIQRNQRATEYGMAFTLMPPGNGRGWQCKLQGSIHRYFNHGVHNADGFTAANLLQTIDMLVSRHSIEPGKTLLNNLEFGVNIALPFPVSRILDNLICYKNRPFESKTSKTGERYQYYECAMTDYRLKLYDKGLQFERTVEGLPANLLRIEIDVRQMKYFAEKNLNIRTLVDLLEPINYLHLGKLLTTAFDSILFDEPSLSEDKLTGKKLSFYLNGSNPRYWQKEQARLDQVCEQYGSRSKPYNAARQRLRRYQESVERLFQEYRVEEDWRAWTSALLVKRWTQVSTVSKELSTAMAARRTQWQVIRQNRQERNDLAGSTGEDATDSTGQNRQKRNNLASLEEQNRNNLADLHTDARNNLASLQTPSETPETPEMSQSSSLDIVRDCDSSSSPERVEEEPLSDSSSVSIVEGEDLGSAGSVQRASASSGAVESLVDRLEPVRAKRPAKTKTTPSPKKVSAAKYMRERVVDPVRSVPKPMTEWRLIEPFEPVPPVFPHPSTLGRYTRFDEQERRRRWCPLTGIETTAQQPDQMIILCAVVEWHIDNSGAAFGILLDGLFHQYQIVEHNNAGDNSSERRLLSSRVYRLLIDLNTRWAALHGEEFDKVFGQV